MSPLPTPVFSYPGSCESGSPHPTSISTFMMRFGRSEPIHFGFRFNDQGPKNHRQPDTHTRAPASRDPNLDDGSESEPTCHERSTRQEVSTTSPSQPDPRPDRESPSSPHEQIKTFSLLFSDWQRTMATLVLKAKQTQASISAQLHRALHRLKNILRSTSDPSTS